MNADAISTNVPFATLWIGRDLTFYEQLSLTSFQKGGHDITLFAYNHITNVPKNVRVMSADRIVSRDLVFQNPDAPTYAMFANFFRYKMIQVTGYAWFDADLVRLHGTLPHTPYLFAYESPRCISNAFLTAPPDSQLVTDLIEGATPMLANGGRHVPWGTYGPRLLTMCVNQLDLNRFALRVDDVYPVHYADLHRLFSITGRDRRWCESATQTAMTVHLWNKFLVASGQKSFAPAPQSYLGQLMLQHDIKLHPPYVDSRALISWKNIFRRSVRRLRDVFAGTAAE
jgi:hypothetical protein